MTGTTTKTKIGKRKNARKTGKKKSRFGLEWVSEIPVAMMPANKVGQVR